MAKRLVKKILLEDLSDEVTQVYRRVYEEVPDEVEEEEAPEESLPEPEPVAEEPKWSLSMSNTKVELLVEAERLGLDVNSGNTKSEILAAIDASQE